MPRCLSYKDIHVPEINASRAFDPIYQQLHPQVRPLTQAEGVIFKVKDFHASSLLEAFMMYEREHQPRLILK
jgi:hypothetical protein